MVARITTGTSINGVLNYNEKKVEQSVASLLYAGGFPMDGESLSLEGKQTLFQMLTRQNIRTKTNTMHITLNFSPKDNLDKEKLIQIADDYMRGIGFGGQPVLVYQHFDAAHPHIHLATVTIANGGLRLPTHNIGRMQSSRVRREIEETYKLIKVEDVQKERLMQLEQAPPVKLERIVYGAVGTRDTIFSIVNEVVNTYKYSTLQGLNAVLNQFGVAVDGGLPGSRMHANGGLVYALIDENYKRVGSAINASLITGKPTLKNLQVRYELNESGREPYGQRLRYIVDKAMRIAKSQEEFGRYLKGYGVRLVFRRNGAGDIFGVNFIDNATRVVYDGRDLGEKYTAQRLLTTIQLLPSKLAAGASARLRDGFGRGLSAGVGDVLRMDRGGGSRLATTDSTVNKEGDHLQNEGQQRSVLVKHPGHNLPVIQVLLDSGRFEEEEELRRKDLDLSQEKNLSRDRGMHL